MREAWRDDWSQGGPDCVPRHASGSASRSGDSGLLSWGASRLMGPKPSAAKAEGAPDRATLAWHKGHQHSLSAHGADGLLDSSRRLSLRPSIYLASHMRNTNTYLIPN